MWIGESIAWNRREFLTAAGARLAGQERGGFVPRGRIHIAIGVPDALNSLKTLVEAEGKLSPGFGTYGIYYWLETDGKLFAPTQDGMKVDRGLAEDGLLIPWCEWEAPGARVFTVVCRVGQVVASQARVQNAAGASETKIEFRG